LRKNLLPNQSRNRTKAAQEDGNFFFQQVRVQLLQRTVNTELSAAMNSEMNAEMKNG
jgi:hypothetical protein